MNKMTKAEFESMLDQAWEACHRVGAATKDIFKIANQNINEEGADANKVLKEAYERVNALNESKRIYEISGAPEAQIAHYNNVLIGDFHFYTGIGTAEQPDWLDENEMIISRASEATFEEAYKDFMNPEYLLDRWQWKSEKEADEKCIVVTEKYTLRRLAWGDHCKEGHFPDFLITRK